VVTKDIIMEMGDFLGNKAESLLTGNEACFMTMKLNTVQVCKPVIFI
jgi:hypothetical protein